MTLLPGAFDNGVTFWGRRVWRVTDDLLLAGPSDRRPWRPGEVVSRYAYAFPPRSTGAASYVDSYAADRQGLFVVGRVKLWGLRSRGNHELIVEHGYPLAFEAIQARGISAPDDHRQLLATLRDAYLANDTMAGPPIAPAVAASHNLAAAWAPRRRLEAEGRLPVLVV